MTIAFLRLGLARRDKVRGQINISWVTCGRNDLPGFAFSAIIWLAEIKRLKLSVSDLGKRVRTPTMPANLCDKKKKKTAKNQVDTTYTRPVVWPCAQPWRPWQPRTATVLLWTFLRNNVEQSNYLSGHPLSRCYWKNINQKSMKEHLFWCLLNFLHGK